MDLLKKMILENIKQRISETVRDIRNVSKKHGIKGVTQYVSLLSQLALYDNTQFFKHQESTRRLRSVPTEFCQNIEEKYTQFGIRHVTDFKYDKLTERFD